MSERFTSAKAEICARFEKSGDVEALLSGLSAEVDRLVTEAFGAAGAVSILATGGYGRRELFPYSDIDLLLVHRGMPHGQIKKMTDAVLYPLWNLGLAVGHAVRTTDEAIALARQDSTVRTSLLDARLVCGDAALFDEFHARFAKEILGDGVVEFVEAKLEERDRRHRKAGDSRYLLEPNVKEGKGGLRDLHTLRWLVRYADGVRDVRELVGIGRLTEEEYRAFAAAERFLSLVRAHLHLAAGRAEEQLTFDLQPQIAGRMGYRGATPNQAVERFMKRYFVTTRIVGALTRIFCANLEEEKKRKPRFSPALEAHDRALGVFVRDGDRLNLSFDALFDEDPARLIELFAVAHRERLELHPYALRQVTRRLPLIDRALRQNARANAWFLELLLSPQNPEPALRTMHDAGVLARFVPDFGRVAGQMQFDRYHIYTVDEHILHAVGLLHRIEHGEFIESLPVASEVVHTIASRRVLYLALFCHDLAKGRGGDHPALGVAIAEKLARRLGFDALETETCGWLVAQHLVMSHTAFKRDIRDPQTLRDFVSVVQSPERLKLLLVLTVTDIRAVGPQVWNGWKGALLRELYHAAAAAMGAGDAPTDATRTQALKAALAEELFGWTTEEIDAYLSLGAPSFLADHDASTHAAIARLLRQQHDAGDAFIAQAARDEFHSVTQLIVIAPDRHGLFSQLAGALALSGANIVGAKIATLKHGMAVDVFRLQDASGAPWDAPRQLKKFQAAAARALAGKLDLESEMARRVPAYPTRMDVFRVPVGVFIDNDASAQYTVIEVDGRDRVGFLYRVTRALADLKLNIATAHISTYGVRAVDVFYVKDAFGMKIVHEAPLAHIRETLTAALAGERTHESAA